MQAPLSPYLDRGIVDTFVRVASPCPSTLSPFGVPIEKGESRRDFTRAIALSIAGVKNLVRQSNTSLTESLLPAQAEDVQEMDELVTFVGEKWFKRWLWTAQCRRPRPILAFVIGDRSETTAQKRWQAIPESYRGCPVFTDQFHVSPVMVLPEQHQPVPKGAGLTHHQERWYNTLRQWVGRYTRRTLSFSKEDRCHELVTRWFILQHNIVIRDASRTM